MRPKMPTDEMLMIDLQGGNHSAFRALVDRHTTRFYRLAFRYLGNQHDAEDIVQMAFLKLWENPMMWRQGQAAFTTFFSRVVINLCLDQQKKKRPSLLPEDVEIKDDRALQLDKVMEDEKQAAVAAAIQQLPHRQRAALILCYYQGHAHKDAADIMKVSEKALQSLLMRSKGFLKQRLGVVS